MLIKVQKTKALKTVNIYLILFALTMFLSTCSKNDEIVNPDQTIIINFTFENNDEGWMGGFADYPANIQPVDWQMEYSWCALPNYILPKQYGFRIQGNNHSDDLFMFIKKQVTGLKPSTTYKIVFEIELASKAPTNAAGIGGAPGEAVTLKAGATLIEPKPIISGTYYTMNIDKDNQSSGGNDMIVIGNVGVSDTTTQFTLVNRNNTDKPFTLTTDSKGEIWLIIGTDSGFEGSTELYYSNVKVKFTPN